MSWVIPVIPVIALFVRPSHAAKISLIYIFKRFERKTLDADTPYLAKYRDEDQALGPRLLPKLVYN